MTVAPEFPPVPVARCADTRRRARAVVGVDRTPAGVVALVEPPRPRPAARTRVATEPGAGRVHRPAGLVPVHPAPTEDLAEGTWFVPATHPVRTRAEGARVVRPAGGALRLTRRGRIAAAAAILLIAVLALVGVTSRLGSLSEHSPVPSSAPAQVRVAPGETLWSIAERVAPKTDPRTVVAAIRDLNHLPTNDVRPGQTLLLRTP